MKIWMWVALVIALLLTTVYKISNERDYTLDSVQIPAIREDLRCDSFTCPPGTSVSVELADNPPQSVSSSENQVYNAEYLQGISFIVIEQSSDAPQDTAKLVAPGGAMYMVPWKIVSRFRSSDMKEQELIKCLW